jgi:hypothetical protein
MTKEQLDEIKKLLNEYLSEELASETPKKRALLTALAPMGFEALYPPVMQGGASGVAASKLIFEVVGLIGRGQKTAHTSKDKAP